MRFLLHPLQTFGSGRSETRNTSRECRGRPVFEAQDLTSEPELLGPPQSGCRPQKGKDSEPFRRRLASIPNFKTSRAHPKNPPGLRLRWSASRMANATMVRVGLEWPAVGKTELPATKRLVVSWTLQSESTTPCVGSWCMRVVPIW